MKKLKDFKKLKKLGLLVCALMLVGCGASKSDVFGEVSTVDTSVEGYTMSVPKDQEAKKIYNSQTFKVTKEKNDLYYVISSNKNPDSVAKLVTPENIQGYFSNDRNNALASMLDDVRGNRITRKAGGDPCELAGYECIKYKGELDLSDDKGRKMKFASYNFFVDKDNKIPFEVLVASETASDDLLDTAAKEIVKSINKK